VKSESWSRSRSWSRKEFLGGVGVVVSDSESESEGILGGVGRNF
jgi:hypothetical protein